MLNDKAFQEYDWGHISSKDPAYQAIVDAFQELKNSRLHVIDQFMGVLHSYIKELEFYISIQNQLVEKIDQYELLLKENLLVTRSAKPVSLEVIDDFNAAISWLASNKTRSALIKVIDKVWLPALIIMGISLLIGLILGCLLASLFALGKRLMKLGES